MHLIYSLFFIVANNFILHVIISHFIQCLTILHCYYYHRFLYQLFLIIIGAVINLNQDLF